MHYIAMQKGGPFSPSFSDLLCVLYYFPAAMVPAAILVSAAGASSLASLWERAPKLMAAAARTMKAAVHLLVMVMIPVRSLLRAKIAKAAAALATAPALAAFFLLPDFPKIIAKAAAMMLAALRIRFARAQLLSSGKLTVGMMGSASMVIPPFPSFSSSLLSRRPARGTLSSSSSSSSGSSIFSVSAALGSAAGLAWGAAGAAGAAYAAWGTASSGISSASTSASASSVSAASASMISSAGISTLLLLPVRSLRG